MLLPETTPAPIMDSLEIRQAFRVVTQTLIRQSTTITTTLTLGTEVPTSTPAPLTTPTAAPPPAHHHHHHPHLTGGQVAGILCGVIGLVAILLIVGIFYINTSRMPITYEPEGDSGSSKKSHRSDPSYRYVEETYYTTRKKKKRRSSSSVEPLQRPPPVVERVPGGPKFPTYRALPIANPRNPQTWRVG